MRNLLALLVGAFFFLSPAYATVVITKDGGGGMDEYYHRYETIRASGDTVRVEGLCASACTFMLGIVPDNRVCVTSKAVFGFHSASWFSPTTGQSGFSVEGTRQLWAAYPARVRSLLRARGWDGTTEHTDLILIDGRLLYKACRTNVNMAGSGWMFPPRSYDPNAPIEQPDVIDQPLPLPPPPFHHTKPAPAPKPVAKPVPVKPVVRKPVVVAPVIPPTFSLPKPPKVELPAPHPVEPKAFPLEGMFTALGAGFAIALAIVILGIVITQFVRGFLAARKGLLS